MKKKFWRWFAGIGIPVVVVSTLIIGDVNSVDRYSRAELDRIRDVTQVCTSLDGVVELGDYFPFYRENRLRTIICTMPGLTANK